MTRWGKAGAILAFALAAAAVWAVRSAVFQDAPITTDENSYVFQAYTLLEGRVSRPVPPSPGAFFHEMIIQNPAVGWLSRYPPGHAIWLMPGCLVDRPHLMVAAGAGLSLLLLMATGARLGVHPALIAFLALASPFFLLTHGTLLSHTTGFLSVALMLWCHVRWRSGGAVAWAAAAGLAWGWLAMNRTYTAGALAIPLGAEALAALWRARGPGRGPAWRGTIAFACAATAGIVALLLYNWLAVGDPLTMSYLFYDPSENPGFGPRHTSGVVIQHTPSVGLQNLADNLRLYDRWLWGFGGGLAAVAALALWLRDRWAMLYGGCFLAAAVSLVCFWYPGPTETGPGYLFESLPFVLLVAGRGLTRLVRSAHLPPPAARTAVAALVLAAAAAAALHVFAEGAALRRTLAPLAAAIRVVRSAPPEALLFATPGPYTRGSHGVLVFNPKGLQSRPLVVRSVDAMQDRFLATFLTDRRPMRLRASGAPALEPMDWPRTDGTYVRAAERMHARTGSFADESGGPGCRFAEEGQHAEEWLAFGVPIALPAGRYQMEFECEVAAGRSSKPSARLDIARAGSDAVICSAAVTGTSGRVWIPLRLQLAHPTEIEPRVRYLGRGTVRFYQLRLTATP